jgi:superfamily II DNA or RNA helicase
VLATGRYVGEGFDEPRLDTLLLAMPIAWRGTVVQYAGRLHRAFPGKRDTLIYDYVDAELPVLRRMFAKRLKAYHPSGMKLREAEIPVRCPAQQGL